MITTSKVKTSFIEKLKLIIQVLQYGGKTAVQSSPFGIDSRPIDNMTAIYAETSNSDEAVIIGYIGQEYATDKGEIRLYSIGQQEGVSTVKATVFLKNDGKLVLNGGQNSAVLGEPLKTAILEIQTAINQELTFVSAGIASAGGSYTPTPLNIDITEILSENIKLK